MKRFSLQVLALFIFTIYVGDGISVHKNSPVLTMDAKALDEKTIQSYSALEDILKSDNRNPQLTSLTGIIKELLSGDLKPVAIVERDENVDHAIEKLEASALFLVLKGTPTGRKEGEPLLKIDTNSHYASKLLPFANYMNRVGNLIQSVSKHPVYPFTISSFSSVGNNHAHLLAVYDVTSGTVYVNDWLLKPLDQVPVDWIAGSYEKLISHFEYLQNVTTTKIEDPIDLIRIYGVQIPSILHSSVLVCAACVFILSQIFPLIANYIFINLALFLCQALNLSDAVCQALWTSAVALVFMMLPAMAYAIWIVCNVQACIPHTSTSTGAF